MDILELKNDIYWTGVLDPELRVFDIVMNTEFGTTYNSYVVQGSEKTALIETAKLKFFDSYLDSVKAVTDIAAIDYLIVNHTEPDHAGSIEALIDLNPNIKIVATATAITFLKSIVNRDFYSIAVKNADTLSLGGRTFRFFALPNLHWPDTMYSYLEEDAVLFTCDSFGSHYSHPGIMRSTVTNEADYMRATKYYFDNIIGPFKDPYMLKALDCIKPLKLELICPGHGPVLDSRIDELLQIYREWCTEVNPNPRKKVVIPYVSAYGYTAELAQHIAEGIRDSGDIDTALYDMVSSSPAEVLADIRWADGLLFGTPTIIGEALKPIWDLTTSMFAPIHKGKLASAFGSYGWSGEGVPNIIERLRQLKLKVLDGYKVRFKPDRNQLIDAYEYGYNFGCVLQNKENDRAKKSGVRSLVKCLVCGEIFDSSLDTCPVCGVGRENFIPWDEEVSSFKRDTDENFLILGGGASAFNAAKAIRERNSTASVIILSREKRLPYNRPMLTKSMLAGFDASQLAIEEESWYRDNDILFIGAREIVSIDTAQKEVICKDTESGEGGLKFGYDKLIYSTGADCFVPPIKGAELDGVIAIRSADDADRVKRLLPEVKHAVVIGGGVLGLESAWELSKSKCAVTVLEGAPQLMPRHLDEGAAAMLERELSEHGIALRKKASVTSINGNGNGKVSSVTCDGEEIPCELVIISCGIRANSALASDAGIECGRAVKVNERCETSAKDVFACGDAAEFNGINFGLWAQAVDMGKVAGANAAGDKLVYEQITGALTFNGLGTSLYAVGDNGKNTEKLYKTVEYCDRQKKLYEKYYFHNNRLTGVILLGDTSKMAELTEAVKMNAPFKDVIK